MWLIGDNFIATTYREHFLLRTRMDWFIKDEFEMGVFCKSKFSCNNRNMLSRLLNSLKDGMHARLKLPEVILVVLDCDIISAIQSLKDLDLDCSINMSISIATELYGSWIEWLMEKFLESIIKRHKQLPSKAKCPLSEQPVVYWTLIPNNKNYPHHTRVQIAKFNQSLDSVAKLYSNMRCIKVKDGWDYDNTNLVTCQGRLTLVGMDQYWESIDSSVKYNLNKRREFKSRAFITRQNDDNGQHKNEDPMYSFFQNSKRNTNEKTTWVKSTQVHEDFEDNQRHFKKKRLHGPRRYWLPRVK